MRRTLNCLAAWLLALVQVSALSAVPAWTSNAPDWPSVLDLAVEQSTGVVYASVLGKGMFKSVDAGTTWASVNTGLGTQSPARLLIDTGGTLYAKFSSSIRKSSDGGATWIQIMGMTGSPLASAISALSLGPGGTLFAAGSGGVFRSTNAGANWARVDVDLPGISPQDIVVDAGGLVYLSDYNFTVYKSEDGGVHWANASNGLPHSTPGVLLADGSTIYAGTWWNGVYRSTDGGINWIAVNSGIPSNRGIRSFVRAPTGIYAVVGDQSGGVGVYFTGDGGSSWNPASGLSPIQAAGAIRLGVDAAGNLFLAAAEGGAVRRLAAGGLWQSINSGPFRPTRIRAFAIDGSGAVYAASNSLNVAPNSGLGIFKTTDSGASWQDAVAGLTNFDVNAIVRDVTGTLYASTYWHAIFTRANDAVAWAASTNGLPSSSPAPLAADGLAVYVGTYWNGVYKSTNGGASWMSVSAGIPSGRGVEALAVLGPNALLAWVGDQMGNVGIYKTIDGGANWMLSNTGLGSLKVHCLIVADGGVVYAGTAGGGIYRSVDAGATWGSFSGGLGSNNYVYSLALDSTGALFAGTAGLGVFTLPPGGTNWTPINNGLSNLVVGALGVDFADNVYAGTDSGTFTLAQLGTRPPDLQAPSVPSSVSATAVNVGQIDLTWSKSIDNTGVATYKVYRDGVLVHHSGTMARFRDAGLTASTSFSYTVSACDASGNCSAPSGATTAVTAPLPDIGPPTVPSGLVATPGGSTVVSVSWSASSDDVAVTGYKVYRNGVLVANLGNVTSYLSVGLSGSTSYSFSVSACDAAGHCSLQSIPVPATTAPPTVPNPPLAVTASPGNTIATVIFSAPVSNGGAPILGYTVTASPGGLSASGNASPITIAGLTNGTSYSFTVTSFNSVGNSNPSAPSNSVTPAINPIFAPSLVPGFNLLGNSLSTSLDVVAIFGNQNAPTAATSGTISVWRWDAPGSRWQFHSPLLTATQNAVFASSNNYDVLTSIQPGDGYWVNASAPINLPVQSAMAVNWDAAQFATLSSGWNLLAHTHYITPSQFNDTVNASLPQPGIIPTANFTSLWAWDAGMEKWYFYSPLLEASGGLDAVKAYADSHSHLHFQDFNKILGIGTGFWVNKQ